MAVILKDVDFPDCCLNCVFMCRSVWLRGANFCQVKSYGKIIPEEIIYDARPDWCPLIEIPEGAKVIKNRKIIKEIPDGLVPPWINRIVECEEEETKYEEEE